MSKTSLLNISINFSQTAPDLHKYLNTQPNTPGCEVNTPIKKYYYVLGNKKVRGVKITGQVNIKLCENYYFGGKVI